MDNAEYNDPRLVEIYDLEGPWGQDDAFFVALVNETPSARVLDVGCGTGRLAIALAAAGHSVTGIDPAHASLAAARAKPGSERVTWRHGTAESADAAAFDVAIMTGHAAQFLLTEREWIAALVSIHRALVPGGRFSFHAYDPRSRVWERWHPQASRRAVALQDGTTVTIWTEVTNRTHESVSYAHHYRFANGDQLRSDSSLRFWSEARLTQSLLDAGFSIERMYGGWRGQPVGGGDGELIFIADRQQ